MTPSAKALAISRAASRYRHRGRFARFYVPAKLRNDPLYGDLLDAGESLGHVVDIGCGRGQLAALLLEAGLAERVTGLDWNRAHLDQAEAAMAGLRFAAHARDLAADQSVPDADTVTIIDVLYQLRTDVQYRLLEQAGRAARLRLLIRTPDRARQGRGLFTAWAERLTPRFWPSAGAHVNPIGVDAIAARMAASGFIVEIAPSFRGTPFSNVLLRGSRGGRES